MLIVHRQWNQRDLFLDFYGTCVGARMGVWIAGPLGVANLADLSRRGVTKHAAIARPAPICWKRLGNEPAVADIGAVPRQGFWGDAVGRVTTGREQLALGAAPASAPPPRPAVLRLAVAVAVSVVPVGWLLALQHAAS